MKAVRYFLFILMAIGAIMDAVALEVPYLTGRVNDQADLLSTEARMRIAEGLQGLEQRTGAQVVVLTIPGLETESLESFSIRVAETWKLGRKGADDGVLILVVRDERKIRIEVGYGLESVLTDLASRRVIDHLMVPAFRQGDFEAGIESAAAAVSGAIEGNAEAIPDAVPEQNDTVIEVIFIAIFALMISPFAYFALALPGSAGWFLYLFLMPFFGLFPMVAGNTVALVSVGLWILVGGVLRAVWPEKWRIKSAGEGFSGGWKITSSSSSSSGGGFSGGGGSFGGGGASGSW